MKDSASGKSKGYGFVSFLKKEVCILLGAWLSCFNCTAIGQVWFLLCMFFLVLLVTRRRPPLW